MIELLVVVAIIALLMSILVPALTRAKEQGKRAVCLSNLRQMTIAWMLYCDDNDGKMPDAWALGIDAASGQPPPNTYSWVYRPPHNARESVQIQAIREGKLFEYAAAIRLYKCPTGKRPELVTYSIVISMAGHKHCCVKEHLIARNRTKNKALIRSPAARIVFLDEGKWPGSPWGLHLPNPAPDGHGHRMWWDQPTIRHSYGTNWSFADGHAIYRRWRNQATIDFAKDLTVDADWCNRVALGSEEDYDWIGKGIFGEFYIPP